MIIEEHWQFPCVFGAIDGCDIPLKCPPGGQQSQKEHNSFKGFYSLTSMAILNVKYEVTWAGCGYTGNNHESTIFLATNIYARIKMAQFFFT